MVVHARLPDDLRHIYVFEALKDVKMCVILLTIRVDGR